MDFINDLGDDFKNRLFHDISGLDIVFLVVLLMVLLVSLFSGKIAGRFKENEDEALRLSVKIKTAGLFFAAICALIITQVF